MTNNDHRKAVIDLGTNTFHLLIVEEDNDGSWKEIHRQREYVYLAAEGMRKISDSAFHRGIDTLSHFREILREHEVQNFKATGTAALRTASNRNDFIKKVKNDTGIKIEVIDGLKEAMYISRGVDMAVGNELDEYLIMDIGGGSVEFIHKSSKGVMWEHSFTLGLAVLKSQDFCQDPLNDRVIQRFSGYIHETLSPLYDHIRKEPTLPIVGASGTFEALLQIIPSDPFGEKCRHYTFQALEEAYRDIVQLDIDERLSHPGIPSERAELFSLAILLVFTVAKKLKCQDIYVSPFALKEGVLQSMK